MDRTLIPHPAGNSTLGSLSLRGAKVGPHGLPVIVDKTGTMLEIERPQLGPTGNPLILDDRGQPVEIERVALNGDKKPIFFDKGGSVIPGAKPLIRRDRKNFKEAFIVQKFMAEKTPIFLNLSGNIVEVEQGQADGSILMAQNGSLVYYAIYVNDVYAYFLTGFKNGIWGPPTWNNSFNSQFPTKPWQLQAIIQFAKGHLQTSSAPFPDPEALAVELKTAWVEAAGLANVDEYITMTATIPTYSKTSPTSWKPNGQKTVLMALVGMHVVGSVAGHPEMIWATFEHERNAPDATYTYVSTSGVKSVSPNFSGAHLFCAANPNLNTLNKAHMQEDQDPQNPGGIEAVSSFTISPGDTIRGNAWGAVAGVAPNPVDASEAASNSELISINNDVRGRLKSGDPRSHYLFKGATWTIGGIGFNENFGNPGNPGASVGRAVGTSQLANMTMETYQQPLHPTTHKTTFSQFSNNCFACHNTSFVDVSNIFYTPGSNGTSGVKPLF